MTKRPASDCPQHHAHSDVSHILSNSWRDRVGGGGVGERVCFALILVTGEKKKIYVTNTEEKQICVGFDKGVRGQLQGLEI